MSKGYGQTGLSSNNELGKGGPRLKNEAGTIAHRNSADSAYAEVRGADATTDDALTTKRQLDAVGGGGAAGPTPGVPARDHLVAFYDAGAAGSYPGSGTAWSDIGGAEPDATLTNVTVTDSHLSFSATNARGAVAKTAALDDLFTGGGSICVWVRIRSDGGGGLGAILTARTGNGGVGWTLLARGSPSINIELRHYFTGNEGVWALTNTADQEALPVDRWVCIGVRYDSGNVGNVPDFFIDGIKAEHVYVNTAPTGSTSTDAATDLSIGNSTTLGRNFDGDIETVALFDDDLTDAEFRQFYLATNPRFTEAGMILLDWAAATSDVSSLTVGGISSEHDGPLVVTGRVVFAPAAIFELRPVTGAALSSIRGTILRGDIGRNQATENISTTGWPVVNDNQTGQAESVGVFRCFVWPSKERHGATAGAQTSARMYTSTGVVTASGYTATVDNYAGGHWTTTADTDAFESITIESPTAVNLKTGSEIAVYRLPHGVSL